MAQIRGRRITASSCARRLFLAFFSLGAPLGTAHEGRTCREPAGVGDLELQWSCPVHPHVPRAAGGAAHHSKNATPPLVAWCLAGVTRTFLDPLVYRSFVHNGIQALGAQSVVFLLLKTLDAVVKPGSPLARFQQTIAGAEQVRDWGLEEVAQLQQALDYVRPHYLHLDNYAGFEANRKCTIATDGTFGTEEGLRRVVGNLNSSMQCLRAAERWERKRGLKFDFIIRTRPDLGYFAPIPRFTTLLKSHQVMSHWKHGGAAGDWFYIVPRRVAYDVLGVLETEYMQCRGKTWWGAGYETLLLGVSEKAATLTAIDVPIGLVKGTYCSIDLSAPCRSTSAGIRVCAHTMDAIIYAQCRAGMHFCADGLAGLVKGARIPGLILKPGIGEKLAPCRRPSSQAAAAALRPNNQSLSGSHASSQAAAAPLRPNNQSLSVSLGKRILKLVKM